MKKIKTLHIASFEGNVGDNANHNGTKSLLKKNLPFELEYHEEEIRRYFWKERKFDQSFVEKANQYDLIIFGGGNFFELWVANSCNSTSVDIPINILKKINTPIIFYGLGVDPGQGIASKEKFQEWVEFVSSHQEKYILSVRNDGAKANLEAHFSKQIADKFHCVPDGGFFVNTSEFIHPEVSSDPNKRLIGINIAGDMPEIRFPEKPGFISVETFFNDFSGLLTSLLNQNEDINIVFFIHIYKDIYFLSDLLKRLEDWHIRKRITVSPYLHGDGSEKYIFNLYESCDLVLGNRFHTNVCSIGLGVPTIGLINYPQIKFLYSELGLDEYAIEINKPFSEDLESIINNVLENSLEIKNSYRLIRTQLESDILSFHKYIAQWISQIKS